MKTIYITKYFGPGLDGGQAGSGGAGGIGQGNLIGSAVQAGIGNIQSILGFIQAKKYEKQLGKLQSPVYTPNKSIMDYYNQALTRYQTNPINTALYKRQRMNALSGTAAGLGMLQNRRAGQAGVPALIRAQNDALLNAEVGAENQQNQRFGQLGQATGLKAGEERQAFDINQMQPFERKYNLIAAKAGQGANIFNSGLQNVYGAANSLGQYDMINKMTP